ncbi:mitochondrial protein import protein MAS5 [Diaporthe helianthi]|uniref:Mitochondrial protein import protein MAS5 n=1 Tax=Diaporthe helianthi TaxID=158607 RepID=A0A2P5I953_DIAHE|nr:mitochondrial protein import protein MAS5 [Diaporthe helianthi]
MDSSGPGNGPEGQEDLDLYGLLGLEKTATPDQIKKAYRKAALQHHPDKVPEDRREEAEAKFKQATQAYEILRDDEKREMYDQYGMAAFDPSRGGGPGGAEAGRDEEQQYKVTLEELYKGKTVKFSANKKVNCGQCKGTGGKEKVKPQTCDRCKGNGFQEAFQQIGPGMVRRAQVQCDHCQGSGNYYKEKDRCKRCKGKRIVDEIKPLEIYIPRGSMQGKQIRLEGEADQQPDQTPGDIIFTLVEEPHDVFTRIGQDLSADLNVTLAEALSGFSRVVLKHLDGRGIHIDFPRGKILRPNEVIKVAGEGMPLERGESKGDLYLIAKIEFPENGWLGDDKSYEALQKLLPPPEPPIVTEEVDEVDYEEDVDIEEMGAHSGDARFGGEWEDVDEEEGTTQCATQ